ncbi:hypothetical protein BROUX41_002237 [Berkeleyomyces rouxiae]|uniref:uncharacterized protein n=1 Tax=Berkeleyomyces rouxiae TaxID=2035830 RepID=UPI003B789442
MNSANVNLGGMNPMAGPVGASVPMMNPGAMVMGQQPQPGHQPQPGQPQMQQPQPGQPQMQPQGPPQQQPQQQQPQPPQQAGQQSMMQPQQQHGARPFINDPQHRMILNTYIYDYFIRFGMHDCALPLVKNSDYHVQTVNDENRNNNEDNSDGDNKEDVKSRGDLPDPSLPMSSETSFLLEWFAVFWDIYGASRGNTKNINPFVSQYVNHTQAQPRMRQVSQHDLLRQVREGGGPQIYSNLMRMSNNGMAMMKPGAPLARAAIANSNGQMMLQQQKHGMPREGGMDANRDRPPSPGASENVPSPSKKARVDGGFNPSQANMMMNGRPAGMMPGQQPPGGANGQANQQLLLGGGINPNPLTAQQMQQFNNGNQPKSIATYAATLQQHHGQQMPGKQMPGGPQGQGSPMMTQGPEGGPMGNIYNGGEMNQGPMRPNQAGAPNGSSGQSNHALQDYQMQLMMLEQQNKRRLLIARQEQDNMGSNIPRGDGQNPPGPGPNGQPFPEASPQNKTGASPNPGDMKRVTGPMNNAGISSPAPVDGQNQGSPNPMNMMGGDQMNGAMAHNFMVPNNQMNGGMRPPSSHPQFANGQMAAQQMMVARQQQQQQQQQVSAQNNQGQWQQNGMNGNQMMQPGQQQNQQQNGPQGNQGQGAPVQGTPQQRAVMPPPSAPNAVNSRTNTSSPQQGTPAPPTPQQPVKAAPKKKETKTTKTKAAAQKKGGATAGATPVPESAEIDAPTPATPITPANPVGFKPNAPQPGGGIPTTIPNSQAPSVPGAAPPAGAAAGAAAAPGAVAQPHADPNFNVDANNNMVNFGSFELADPLNGDNVLDGFDFDAFIQTDADNNDSFDFGVGFSQIEGGEIGAD